jgi:hypothetical protein
MNTDMKEQFAAVRANLGKMDERIGETMRKI